MGQVTIYLDDEAEAKMRKAAKAMKISQSKWIASLIKKKTMDEWPGSVKALAGQWQDFPSIDEIRENTGDDVVRELL